VRASRCFNRADGVEGFCYFFARERT
jgi:hypothetical protein